MKEEKEEGMEEEQAAEEEKEEQAEEEYAEEEQAIEEESQEGERKDKFGRTLYKVKCSDCGKETEVPFKPSGDRPVYCRECYQKHRPRRRF